MHKIYALVEIDSLIIYANKATSVQALRGTEGSRMFRIPDFMKIGTWRWYICQPYYTGRLYPRKYSLYTFLLETESTPGPQCGRKDYVNKKFQCHHRESKPRPSVLQHSASNKYTTACLIYGSVYIKNKSNLVCLFSWRYNPSGCIFHSPVAGFSLLVFKVSWSHTTTRHSR
jgi:hypothetical protein